jgi:hypothetical protein
MRNDFNSHYNYYKSSRFNEWEVELGHRNHILIFNRFHQLNPSDNEIYVEEDEQFNLSEHFGYAWSLLREGQIYEVVLKFSPEIAVEVAEVQWHKTQNVAFEEDGSAILKFMVDGLNEITWWILSYSNMVEVFSPGILRQRIVQIDRKSQIHRKPQSKINRSIERY